MGERLNDGGAAHGHRRRAHPDGTASPAQAHGITGETGIEELLAVVLRDTGDGTLDGSEGERRAVAAFRAARDAGTHRARTRRRDDWRPREQRTFGRRSVKATLSVAVASLALGGVAVAAIGGVGSDDEAGHAAGPSATTASAPGDSAGPSAGGPSTANPAGKDRPETAQDTEAHCRAWGQGKDKGKSMDATALQRLVAAAGGEENVEAYCARQTTPPTPSASAEANAGQGDEENTKANTNANTNGSGSGSGSSGGGTGNATDGNAADGGTGNAENGSGADKATGKGQ